MTRRTYEELVEFDPEIERIFSRLRRAIHQKFDQSSQIDNKKVAVNQSLENIEVNQDGNNNANSGNGARRIIVEFARPVISEINSSIIRPRVEANNFEIKPNIIQMI
jgi:hypothetical protein